MAGKVCMVTGANAGIGKHTALGLARQGAHVVLACRNREKGEATRTEIVRETGNSEVDLVEADMASQASIRRFAAEALRRYKKIDVLVNNAGLYAGTRRETEDGLEWTFAVNHIGYFLATILLLDRLKASAPARVVCVSSEGHRFGRIRFNDLQLRKSYTPMAAYNQSKLANVLFAYELARRLKGAGVTANCLHPGAVGSNFGSDSTPRMRLFMKLARPFLITPERGARTSIHLASSPRVSGVTGKYFWGHRAVRSSRASYNLETARRLWEVSEQLCGLDGHG